MALSTTDRFALALTEGLLDFNRAMLPTRTRVQSALRVLEQKIIKHLNAAMLDDAVMLKNKRARIEKVIRDATKDINKTFERISEMVAKGMEKALRKASSEAAKRTKKLLGTGRKMSDMTRRAEVRNHLMLGDTIKAWIEAQKGNFVRKLTQTLRVGVEARESTAKLAGRVRGGYTGRTISVTYSTGKKVRLKETTGGALAMVRRYVDDSIRTYGWSLTQRAWQYASEGSSKVIGWAAVTVLDERTSRICMARTGAMWYLDGAPMPNSVRQEPFPGPPPWHWNCRSSIIPVTDETAVKVKTFDDWLDARGEDYAKNKLGPGLYALWKSGKITLSQLVDEDGKYRSLDQLRKNPRKP